MNYYPYFNNMTTIPAKAGFFKNLLGGINFSSILNGTQKTLGIVNQAIPLIKQAKPVFNNAKTMFKVMNEFKKTDINFDNSKNNTNSVDNINTVNNIVNESVNIKTNINKGGPIFFQ